MILKVVLTRMLTDALGRRISYLRISVVDACNLRCVYCMPAHGMHFTKFSKLMSPREIGIISSAAASLGTTTIRITGGEPLVRQDVEEIAAEIAEAGIRDIPISTNGIFLEQHAEALASSGVTRANVSLDTLNAERFRSITRGGDIQRVLNGIEAAERSGIWPIKLNTVLMKGVNTDELVELAEFALTRGYSIRFIEMMPLKNNVDFQPELFFPAALAKRKLSSRFTLHPSNESTGQGPAVYYNVEGYEGKIGFITPLSGNFCSRCNRVRITSDGRLRMCLFGDNMLDIVGIIRSGGGEKEVADALRHAIAGKPERHFLDIGKTSSETLYSMSQIGG
jgi:cyclic pyranopterin phosphate synthase